MPRIHFPTRTLAPLLLLLFLTACSFSLAEDIIPPPGAEAPAEMPTQSSPSGPLYPLVPPNPAEGAPIYAEKCAPCHGVTGKGDGPQANQLPNPPAALGSPDVARQAVPSQWYVMVTQGNLERFMPPFNSLTDRQRWDVVAYALTLSNLPETVSRGQDVYQANCADCHGAQGQGDGAQAASLNAKPTNFTDQGGMAGKSNTDFFQVISAGVEPAMPGFADRLSEDERWALAAYLRSLTFTSATHTAGQPGTPSPGSPAITGLVGTPESTAEELTTGSPEATATISGSGTVSGQVVNASGGEIPPDLTVALHGFDEMQQALTATTTVHPDGSFTFEGVEMPVGRAFITSVEYNQVAYSSDVAVAEPDKMELILPIAIYETTTDLAVLSVDRLHLLLEYVEPDTLRVVELYIISNLSDRALAAADEGAPVVTYTLPEGATNLQFQDGALGERYVETPGGFGDTSVIRPGSGGHQVVFSYDMPYKRKLELVQPIDLPTSAIVILVPENGMNLKSEQLQDAGLRPVQDLSYHMYTGDRLEAGSELAMTISGRPKGTTKLVTGSSTGLLIGGLALGFALIAVGVWLYRRNRAGGAGDLDDEGGRVGELSADTTSEDAETLLDAILAVDDQYQAGELPEEAYRQRRAELKARLKKMLGS